MKTSDGSFELFAKVDSLSTKSVILCDEADTNNDKTMHSLSDKQRQRLHVVKEKFLWGSFNWHEGRSSSER